MILKYGGPLWPPYIFRIKETMENHSSIDYKSVCQAVGQLYLELFNTKEEAVKEKTTLIQNLQNQVAETMRENSVLSDENQKLKDSINKIQNEKE